MAAVTERDSSNTAPASNAVIEYVVPANVSVSEKKNSAKEIAEEKFNDKVLGEAETPNMPASEVALCPPAITTGFQFLELCDPVMVKPARANRASAFVTSGSLSMSKNTLPDWVGAAEKIAVSLAAETPASIMLPITTVPGCWVFDLINIFFPYSFVSGGMHFDEPSGQSGVMNGKSRYGGHQTEIQANLMPTTCIERFQSLTGTIQRHLEASVKSTDTQMLTAILVWGFRDVRS